jgi:uncharacterized membrane protein
MMNVVNATSIKMLLDTKTHSYHNILNKTPHKKWHCKRLNKKKISKDSSKADRSVAVNVDDSAISTINLLSKMIVIMMSCFSCPLPKKKNPILKQQQHKLRRSKNKNERATKPCCIGTIIVLTVSAGR